MNQTHHSQSGAAARQDPEARLGQLLSARLSERSEQLPHDVSERLRFARETALKRARDVRLAQRRVAPQASAGVVRIGSSAALSGGPERSSWWLKFASVLPLLALMAGLVLIHESQLYEQIVAAADVDTALLADNLPPTAYSDPGFSEYLSGEDE
jgi:hypothetical protein